MFVIIQTNFGRLSRFKGAGICYIQKDLVPFVMVHCFNPFFYDCVDGEFGNMCPIDCERDIIIIFIFEFVYFSYVVLTKKLFIYLIQIYYIQQTSYLLAVPTHNNHNIQGV